MMMVCWRVALFFLTIFIWAAGAPVLIAQAQRYEGKTITAIQFEPAAQPLEPTELNQILPLKVGQPLRMEDVHASIERLFATGRYADIQVDAQPAGSGVLVRFLTRNSWFTGNVEVTGVISSPPNSSQLENATQLDLGQPYSDTKLRQALEGQHRLLESNGLFRPQIKPVFEYDPKFQQVHVRFEVTSGPRARFTTPVIKGDPKIDPQRIFSATRWRRAVLNSWRPVTQARVRQGLDNVRSLFQKENRLEAKVTLESMKFDPEMQSALPTLRIDAGRRIEVRTVGADISQKKLRRFVPIFEEHAVDHDLLVEGSRNLRDYLQSQGYFDAQVDFEEQPVSSDHAFINFLVDRGKRHKLVAIEIAGNRFFSTEAIRERMLLQTSNFLQFRYGRFSEALLRRDRDAITNLYQSNGFRDVKVTSRTVDDYLGRIGELAVFIEINEGPQYFVNSLIVEGIEHLDKNAIIAKLSSVQGQPFSEFNVAVDRDTILGQYFQMGFPNATFEWSSQPSPDPHRVDLRFVINEGSQQFVRDVLISGLETTRPSLVYRNLKLKAGDPLSPTAITETQRRLYDLGIFEKVDAAIQDPDGDTPSKFVLYNMTEGRRYSMAVGVGAEVARVGGCQTCLDSPAGQAGVSPRLSFSVARNNLWGLAHTISLRTRVSTLEQQALLNYSWPHFQNNDALTLSFSGLFLQSSNINTFTSKREEGSVQLSQRVSKATTLLYRYAYRRVSVSTLKISPLLIPLLSQPVRLGLASVNWIQDRRDDPLDPHRGIYNTVDVGLADRIFGSQRNFVRFLARNSTYHPIGKNLVFARNTEFGDISSFNFNGDPQDAIPLPERFFAGGVGSNRGFPEFQSGPRDPNTGFPIGGNALLFNQTELRFPLIGDNIGGVLFHDMGNTYSSLENISFRVNQRDVTDFDYMVHAVGLGVRYRTPIGPLRLDLAYSINPPSFFGFQGSQQDLINAGVNPCAPRPGVPSQCTVQSISHFQFFFSIGQSF